MTTDEDTSPAGLKGGQGRSGEELERQTTGYCWGCLIVVLLGAILGVLLTLGGV